MLDQLNIPYADIRHTRDLNNIRAFFYFPLPGLHYYSVLYSNSKYGIKVKTNPNMNMVLLEASVL